ncbi:hypothetical protein L7F22_011441 [Adiantum nelumboides]|nr:hypothetical protein [Adiantum nelumboides]
MAEGGAEDEGAVAVSDEAIREAQRLQTESIARKYLAEQTQEVIIPSYSTWFAFSSINAVEKRSLPEFFNNRNRSKTPAIYKDYAQLHDQHIPSQPERVPHIYRLLGTEHPGVTSRGAQHGGYSLCPSCYLEGRSLANMYSGDFVRLDEGPFKQGSADKADWSDAETLRLLEGLELFDDDWTQISNHVGDTESRAVHSSFPAAAHRR